MKKIFITTIVLAIIQFARAQTDSAKINLLDDVVVTATKSPKKLSETGKVLIVITQQQLQQNSLKFSTQLLKKPWHLLQCIC